VFAPLLVGKLIRGGLGTVSVGAAANRTIVVHAAGQGTAVWAGSQQVLPGRALAIQGGHVSYAPAASRGPHAILVTQPGFTVRIVRAYDRRARAYQPW